MMGEDGEDFPLFIESHTRKTGCVDLNDRWYKMKKPDVNIRLFLSVAEAGLEPATFGL